MTSTIASLILSWAGGQRNLFALADALDEAGEGELAEEVRYRDVACRDCPQFCGPSMYTLYRVLTWLVSADATACECVLAVLGLPERWSTCK